MFCFFLIQQKPIVLALQSRDQSISKGDFDPEPAPLAKELWAPISGDGGGSLGFQPGNAPLEAG